MPAGEIDAAVRSELEEPEICRPVPILEGVDAEHLTVIWKSLDEPSQDALLSRLIKCVGVDRRTVVIAVSLQQDCVQRLADGFER